MLSQEIKKDLTNKIQNSFSDLDIYREIPFVFESEKFNLIVKPVTISEHAVFLKQMVNLMVKYYEIFRNLEFLSAQDYRENQIVNKLVDQVRIFSGQIIYKKFVKDSSRFIYRWAFIQKGKKIFHSKRKSKKIVRELEPDKFIYILFLLFVFNFDIVKKNTLEFLKMFHDSIEIQTPINGDISSTKNTNTVIVMPKYSRKPYSKQILDLFEQQSKMN